MDADRRPDLGARPRDRLADVRRHRRQLDLAAKALEAGCESRPEHSQLSVHAAGARSALEAAVRRAARDPDAADDAELVALSGLSPARIAALADAAGQADAAASAGAVAR